MKEVELEITQEICDELNNIKDRVEVYFPDFLKTKRVKPHKVKVWMG